MGTIEVFLSAILLLVSSGVDSTPRRQMAITLDDLPQVTVLRDPQHRIALNERLVRTLVEADVPAVGFVNGAKCFRDEELVEHQREILRSWVEAGFELGNHTWSHPDFNDLALEEFVANLERGEEFVQSIRGREPKIRWFRHPYLHRGDTDEKRESLEAYVKSRGYREAVVSIDNAEWMFARSYDLALKSEDAVLAARIGDAYVAYMMEVVAYWEAQSRAILGRNIRHVMLLHANTINADYLGRLLERWRELGYGFISLEEALADSAYANEDRFTGRAGISWIHRWALTQQLDPKIYEGEPRVPDWVRGDMQY